MFQPSIIQAFSASKSKKRKIQVDDNDTNEPIRISKYFKVDEKEEEEEEHTHISKEFIVTKPSISLVSTENAVELLLGHPLTRELSLDDTMFLWKNSKEGKDVYLEGITKTLKSKFYPTYEPAANRKGTSNKASGTKVHRQIFHMIECVKKRSGDCICKGTKTYKGRLHRWTKQALSELNKENISVKACEVVILSKRANRATAIDAIGKRNEGKKDETSVHISFKTGYKVGYDVNLLGQYMEPPLANVLSTPKNHNELQLWTERTILTEEYGIHFDEHITLYLGHGDMDQATIESLGTSVIKDTNDAKIMYEAYCIHCRDIDAKKEIKKA